MSRKQEKGKQPGLLLSLWIGEGSPIARRTRDRDNGGETSVYAQDKASHWCDR
jgi:hypothetical protein